MLELCACESRHPAMNRRWLLMLAVLVLIACTQPSRGQTYVVAGRAEAGPTCPVEPASPAPGQCAPRSVAGAVLVIADAAGRQLVRLTTAADGAFSTQLPAGSYVLTPQPVEGLMSTAPALPFVVSAEAHPVDVRVEYDTGIR